MLEIRIHGRGGQGNVVAAYLLAATAIQQGRYAQAFPSFGAERRGAPVSAFVRIADRPVRRRNQVSQPAFLIIQDRALLQVPGILQGLAPGGGVLVNSADATVELDAELSARSVTLPATALARQYLGRPMPNTALLAAFLALTGILPIAALEAALAERFKGKLFEDNRALVRAAAQQVEANLWGNDVASA